MWLECGLGYLPLTRGIFIPQQQIFLLTFVFHTLKVILDIITRENYNSTGVECLLMYCCMPGTLYTQYLIYLYDMAFDMAPFLWGKLRLTEQGQASWALGHCLWTYTMKLWLAGRVCYFSTPISFCSFPEKKAKKNKMCWYQIFLKEKQLPKSAQRSIRIFIPIFSPHRSTASKMKTGAQAGAPKAGYSTRKQWQS